MAAYRFKQKSVNNAILLTIIVKQEKTQTVRVEVREDMKVLDAEEMAANEEEWRGKYIP